MATNVGYFEDIFERLQEGLKDLNDKVSNVSKVSEPIGL